MTGAGPAYRAIAGPNTRVTIRTRGDAVFVNIHSDRGIGRAQLNRASEPQTGQAVIVRLHLGGLEHFGASSGDAAVHAAVASHGDRTVHQTAALAGDAAPRPIGPDDPLWLDIGQRGARFDVTLPPALCGAASLALEWVDFYR
jgi:hypothetical protein